jgi:hypothetical protein
VRGLAEAISVAARSDALVDAAAPRNRATVEARWNSRKNGPAMVEHYRTLAERKRIPETEVTTS